VVGGGDTHNKGGAKTPNAWFVGMVPRRNPEFAVVVLQEHGDWGRGSALMAAQIVTAYVNKKRKQDGNLMLQADKKPAPVEMGAVWSTPGEDGSADTLPSHKNKDVARVGHPGSVPAAETGMSAGRYVIAVGDKADLPVGNAPLFPNRKPAAPKPPIEQQTEASVALPERFRGVIH
jgi:hypothetical protein